MSMAPCLASWHGETQDARAPTCVPDSMRPAGHGTTRAITGPDAGAGRTEFGTLPRYGRNNVTATSRRKAPRPPRSRRPRPGTGRHISTSARRAGCAVARLTPRRLAAPRPGIYLPPALETEKPVSRSRDRDMNSAVGRAIRRRLGNARRRLAGVLMIPGGERAGGRGTLPVHLRPRPEARGDEVAGGRQAGLSGAWRPRASAVAGPARTAAVIYPRDLTLHDRGQAIPRQARDHAAARNRRTGSRARGRRRSGGRCRGPAPPALARIGTAATRRSPCRVPRRARSRSASGRPTTPAETCRSFIYWNIDSIKSLVLRARM